MKRYVFFICLILFIFPFFWFGQGVMDLGGDENRLFFYDPPHYLQSLSSYGYPQAATLGRGIILVSYYNIPYVYFISVLKLFLSSSTYVIAAINGLKLAGGFLGIFLVVFSFLKESNKTINKKAMYWAGIIAGIFYVSSLGSYNLMIDWITPMNAQNQVFIYPLISFLIFKLLVRGKYIYLWIALLLTFIFSPNFSWNTAPQLFAFFPLVLIFLVTYVRLFLHKHVSLKLLAIGFISFFGIQAFQFVGQAVNLFSSGNFLHERVTNPKLAYEQGVGYFSGVAYHGKALLNLFLPSDNNFLKAISFISPTVLLLGLIFNKNRKILFICIFFCLTFFFVTANITTIGFNIYKSLFFIPAFSIFRVFYVKWLIVFLFFYSLLIGFSFYTVLSLLKPIYGKWLTSIIFCAYFVIGMPLFLGLPIKSNTIPGSNIKTAFVMDPKYEQTLKFIRNLPNDGKFLVLPLTDFYDQVIVGKDGGAYWGPSSISLLTEKYSFTGDQDFGYTIYDPHPYSDSVNKFAREKNYEGLSSIFATLNIKYILYNSDPRAYEKGLFVQGPYEYVSQSLPKTRQEYSDFIHHLPVSQIYEDGNYTIYQLENSFFNPTIFVPDGIYESDSLHVNPKQIHRVFLNQAICRNSKMKNFCIKQNQKVDSINFTMVNPLEYRGNIRISQLRNQLLIVLQNMYDPGWKLIINGKEISKDMHIVANGYANGWVIDRENLKEENMFVIQNDQQNFFRWGSIITGITIMCIFVAIILNFKKNKK